MRTAMRLAAMLVLAVLLPGAQSAEPGAAKVQIEDFKFDPAEITVPAGTRVTWTNEDVDSHTVVSDTPGLFRSPGLDTGDSFSYTFDKPGTYHFTCSVHPKMVGTVIVK